MINTNGRKTIDLSKRDIKELVPMFYIGTLNIHNFILDYIRPHLPNSVKDGFDRAILSLFARLSLQIGSLACLHDALHFQTVASTSRSVFELVLDMRLLIRREKSDLLKFERYPLVEQYHNAELFVRFVGNRLLKEEIERTSQYLLYNDKNKRRQVIDCVINTWGKSEGREIQYPHHWTNLSILNRAKLCGTKYFEFYNAWFGQMSWHIHSGVVGFTSPVNELPQWSFCIYNELVQELSIDAIRIISDILELESKVDRFPDRISKLQVITSRYLVDV